MTTPDIFISHSAGDREIAKALINLFRSALNVPAERIRCTSVEGYKLPAGANIQERLRQEARDARAFVAIVTRDSIRSTFVLFELGARWGVDRPIVLLLGAGAGPEHLAGPLTDFNALSCEVVSDVHQLVHELATALEVVAGSPGTYHSLVDEVVKASTRRGILSAPLVGITGAVMSGEIGGFPNGRPAYQLTLPLRLVNEGTTAITPEIFRLLVKVDERTVQFDQFPIFDEVEWGSDEQQITIDHASTKDLLRKTDALLPGQSVIALAMFATQQLRSIEELRRIQTRFPENCQLECQDVRGATQRVLLTIERGRPSLLLWRLGIQVRPLQNEP